MNRLANISSTNITVIRGIEDEEYQLITKHMTQIYSFEKYNKQLINIIAIKEEIIEASKKEKTNNLMRLISEFLSAFRTFLDHWETYLKRKYGNESKEVTLFKAATSNEYENVFAYRFTWELRNYIQHEGFPAISSTSAIDELEERHYSLDFDRIELLENGHKWKAVQKDLLKEDCKLDFLKLLPELIESLNRINLCAINNLDIKLLFDSCNEILKYKEYELEGMRLAIITFPPSYPQEIKGKISLMEFPTMIAETILKGITIK